MPITVRCGECGATESSVLPSESSVRTVLQSFIDIHYIFKRHTLYTVPEGLGLTVPILMQRERGKNGGDGQV